MDKIMTIGYEGKDCSHFIKQLTQNNIGCLIDVRNNAFSWKKGFSKKPLQKNLEKAGIGYMHFKELGVDPKHRKNLDSHGKYKQLFAHYRKELAGKNYFLQEIIAIAKNKRVALMCFERDKNYCHRSILAEKLQVLGNRVEHI